MAAVVGVVWLGFSWRGLALACGLYAVRMFGLTAGFHRYLAHRSFKTSRAFQFVLALLGTLAVQKGPLWWAAHHRAHHKYSDTPRDIHSVRQNGFWWAHVKWILVGRFEPTEWDRIKDLATFPELRWLNTFYLVPPVLGAVVLGLTLGAWGVVWGFFVSTTLLWHGTFCVNSLAHVWGRKRYDDGRRQPQQLPHRALHAGRGLAQQPPPLPALGAPGLLLVGARHHPPRAHGAVVGGARLRAPRAAAARARRHRPPKNKPHWVGAALRRRATFGF